MAITDILPGELNRLLVKGNVRRVGRDDIDASGKGLFLHKKFEINKLIEENIFSGMTKFKAQIVTKGVLLGSGGPIYRRVESDNTANRVVYRIRIPEIHQSIPHPWNYDIRTSDYKLYMAAHPLAVYETPIVGDGQGNSTSQFGLGDIVQVTFETGTGGNRFYQPIIEELYSSGGQSGEVEAQVNSKRTYEEGQATEVNVSISNSQIEQLSNNSISGGTTCERARTLYVKLAEKLNSLGGRQLYGLPVEDRSAIIVGLMANAYIESKFQAAIGSTADVTGNRLSGIMGLENTNGRVSDSWGIWQNNISVWDAGGSGLLYYYQTNLGGFAGFPQFEGREDFYNKMMEYVSDPQLGEERKIAVAAALLNEDAQIDYAVSIIVTTAGQAHPREPTAPSMIEAMTEGFEAMGVFFEPHTAEAAAAWWQQVYERSHQTPLERANNVPRVMEYLNFEEECS